MALLKKCDICGKYEGSINFKNDNENIRYRTKFTTAPIKLQIKDHYGELYNLYINMKIEKDSDTQRIKNLYKKINNKDFILQMIMGKLKNQNFEENQDEIMDEEDLIKSFTTKIDNPYPDICDDCKKHFLNILAKSSEFIFSEF